MSEDIGGFPVGSAYVSVSPDAESFPEQLEEQLAGVDIVIQIPVVPDTSGLQEGIDAAAAGSKATVVVPVTADPAGLQESIDAAAKDSGATVVVPMEADPADLASQADAAADAVATEAGTTFGEKFSSVAGQLSLFAPDEGQITTTAGSAGQTAGVSFDEGFSGVASGLGASLGAELTPQATVAGAEAGAGLGGAFAEAAASAVGATAQGWAALTPLAAAEGSEAGSAAAAAFGEAFTVDAGGKLRNALGQFVSDSAPAGTTAGVEAADGFSAAYSAGLAKAVSAATAAWGAVPVAADDAVQAAVKSTASAWGAIIPPAETAGTEAGEAAGTGFMSRLASMLSGVTSMFSGMIPAAEAEGAEAGEAAGAGFASRFAAMMSGVTGSLAGLIPSMEAEGAEAGAATGESFGASLKGVISGSISPMEALLGAGFVAAAADMASHFQSAMEQVHTQAQVAQSAISGLSGQVLDLAGKVGISPDSLAETLYHVESAFQSTGISGQKALQLVQVAAEGARTGGANVVDVVNALDAAMVSGIGGISNYQQAMGALNAIVGSGDMKMQDLADAMGTGIVAVAKSYGQNIYQVGAALATFGDNNIRGAKAATDLRMTMQAILQPVATAGDALHQLGLTSTELGNTMTHKGLTAALAQFVDHLKASKVPVADWGQYITEIFGKKAGAGINVLVDQLSRMQGKLPDIEKGAHGFASAWAATQATTSQKFKELESGLEALMIKIGNGLLPAVDGFMSMVTRNLPTIERLGSRLAHLVAPAVTGFFKVLEGVLKELLGPLRSVTEAVGAGVIVFMSMLKLVEVFKAIRVAWIALQATLEANPWILIATAIAVAAVLIIKYHKQIWDVIKATWDKVASFFTGLYDKIVKPVEKIFDDIKKYVTTGFDAWWKSHGKELEEVWNTVWGAIKTAFTLAWDTITGVVKTAWDLVGPFLKIELALLEAEWKIAWGAITLVVKDTWDVISAVVKVAVQGVEATVKIAWDLLVGIFDVFLDLVTGHWSKAWTDIQDTLTQIWNAISSYLSGVWDDIATLATQIWNNIADFFTTTLHAVEGFFSSAWNTIWSVIKQVWGDISGWFTTWWNTEVSDWDKVVTTVTSLLADAWNTIWGDIKTVWNSIHSWLTTWWGNEVQGWKNIITGVEGWLKGAWDTIKSDAMAGFNAVRSAVDSIWNGIVSDVETAVNKIKSLISGITGGASSAVSSALGAVGIHLARGGVLAGYAPGRDSVNAMLSPGESVLVPEATRAIGAANIDAINAHFSGGRAKGGDGAYAGGGVIPDPYAGTVRHYADGGMVPGGLSPFAAGAAAGQQYSAMNSTGQTGGGDGATFILNFNGTQWPTPEQKRAMMSELSLMIGAM